MSYRKPVTFNPDIRHKSRVNRMWILFYSKTYEKRKKKKKKTKPLVSVPSCMNTFICSILIIIYFSFSYFLFSTFSAMGMVHVLLPTIACIAVVKIKRLLINWLDNFRVRIFIPMPPGCKNELILFPILIEFLLFFHISVSLFSGPYIFQLVASFIQI